MQLQKERLFKDQVLYLYHYEPESLNEDVLLDNDATFSVLGEGVPWWPQVDRRYRSIYVLSYM
jgi:hypothetical protein